MDVTIAAMEWLGQYFDALKDPTEFAKIGRYYAVEDMVGPSYGETTLKTFFREQDGTIRLQPANPEFEPIIVRDCRIQGVVTGVLRRY